MPVEPLLTNLSLEEQLKELENLYAECLTDGMEVAELAHIWSEIKVLRNRLNEPIYSYVTPKEFRF